MNNRDLRFRVGLFVLASLVLLAVLITIFSGFPTLFKRYNRYTVILPEAPGVGAGTPVRRSGVRIGEVENVKLDEETGQVRVSIIVEKQHTIHHSDEATLVHSLLGGDTSIDFMPQPAKSQPEQNPPEAQAEQAPPKPQQEQTPLEPGEEIKGTVQTDINSLLKQSADLLPAMRGTNDEIQIAAKNWGRLGERADVLLQANQEKLVKALDNLNEAVTRLSNLFNEENQRNLSTTLKNVRAGTENMDQIAKNTDELVKESRQTIRRVNESVARADEVLANLQQATKPMAERSGSVMKNLDESTDKLNRGLSDLHELMRTLQQADGTLHRLATDPALYNNLNETACMMARIMPRLDRVLRDMEVFADKIARHPESLGLGGVVSPSAGLKEVPASSSSWKPFPKR
jgi:phospholipid/cholesterol/gamma-HCH transport system substrate-binding protein